MSIELKIKSKHLSLEAKVIKFEEQKLKKQIRWKHDRQIAAPEVRLLESISNHRKWDVRNENRATFLARAFIAGTPYKSVEAKCHDRQMFEKYIVPRIVSMVSRYSSEHRLERKWNSITKKIEPTKESYQKLKDVILAWSEL